MIKTYRGIEITNKDTFLFFFTKEYIRYQSLFLLLFNNLGVLNFLYKIDISVIIRSVSFVRRF